MIEFLGQAFLVLLSRGESGVADLQRTIQGFRSGQDRVPEKVLDRFVVVEKMAVERINEIRDKLSTLGILEQYIISGSITRDQAEKLLGSLLKSYRNLRRDVETIEENFIGHLVRYNKVDLFLTKVAHSLWNETSLPGTPPIVVANTFGYFATQADIGIIFSPPSAAHGILIYPDLCHEFGHIVNQATVLYGPHFRAELNLHIESILNDQRRRSRPLPDGLIDSVRNIWIAGWAEEIACDVFATYLLGPAYVWCNLQVCLGKSNAYEGFERHPSNCARTNAVIATLRRMGQNSEADEIQSIWERYLAFSGATQPAYYNDYHPPILVSAIIDDVETIVRDNGFGPAARKPTIDLLNETWKRFNSDPDTYRSWEEKTLSDLKCSLT